MEQKTKDKFLVILIVVLLDIAMSFAGFAIGFNIPRNTRIAVDFTLEEYEKDEREPKYKFLPASLSNYICDLCEGLELDSDLAVAHLLVENPKFDPNAMHVNENGTIDVGMFQLNDKYLWTTFKNDYWFENIELNPFNWKHNCYIALHLMSDLHKELKVQDDAIMAYNGGRGAVMNGTVKPATYDYLSKVKNNYMLLKSQGENND